MIIHEIKTAKDLKTFYKFSVDLYKNTKLHRSTEDDVMKMLVEKKSCYFKHAAIYSFIVFEQNIPIARFSLINDFNLKDYVQVSFFEAIDNIEGLTDQIITYAKKYFPTIPKIIFGLNGHLNYGAGYLCNMFDKAPIFGLPYNYYYYNNYFEKLDKHKMVSFRFSMEKWIEYKNRIPQNVDFGGITVRCMDKKQLKRDVGIYTYLNNMGFSNHPFWSDRTEEEDFELFYPFRYLLKEENFLIAEHDGKPIGFILWYPDFNELVSGDQHLNILHVLKYKFQNPIKTFRFTEIAVLPEYRVSKAVLAMILTMIPFIENGGYTFGEGGFIFEENKNSISMTLRYLKRAFNQSFEPYREYAVYESNLI